MIKINPETGEVGISPMPKSMSKRTNIPLSICKTQCSIGLCAQLVLLFKALENGGFTKEEVLKMITTSSTVFVEKGDEIQ